MPGKAAQRGYTLLEVLVAFAILAITLSVLFRIFASGLTNVGAASEYLQAVVIGEARIEALGRGVTLEPGRSQGTELGRFHWTQTISEANLQELGAAERSTIATYRINVAVEWPAGRNTRQIELETLRVAALENTAGMRR